MSKLYALCDVNNFYVSCERAFNPKLENTPCLVLSNNDGNAVARSNEVKSIGVKMGDPLHKIQNKISKYGIQVFSSNYTLYGDLSNRFVTMLEQHCDQVEQYSVDESFLVYEGFKNSELVSYNQSIVKKVKQGIGLPICIGIAPTKTLSKVANHYAKTLKMDGGVLLLNDKYSVRNALEILPVNEIWGVGRQTTKKLNAIGIYTALQLRNADLKIMQRMFSVNLERTILELRGKPCYDLKVSPPSKQQIMCSRSFGAKTSKFEDVREAIAYQATKACEKLRLQKSLAKTMIISIRTNAFSQYDEQYSAAATIEMPDSSDNTGDFLKGALRALKSIYRDGYQYKRAMVMLGNFEYRKGKQADIFYSSPSSDSLMSALDRINGKFGAGTARYAMEGFETRGWQMKSEHKSPQYTTKWSDIIRVS